MSLATKTKDVIPGVITPGILYRIDEAKARLGWRNASYRAACRRGLNVHRCGKRVYVTGEELIRFITTEKHTGEEGQIP